MQYLSRVFVFRFSLAAVLCSLTFFFTSDARAIGRSYFNMRETFSGDITPFPKWTGMQDRFGKQRELPDEECAGVRFHSCVAAEWRGMFVQWREKKLLEQLKSINDFANAHPYLLDQLNWGMEDYWETPYEFLVVNGDCEDYAIAKYYTLRALGVPASQLRVIIVQDFNLGGIIHAILGVYDDDKLYILDNQIAQVMRALSIYHYKPIYGINEEGWWAYYPK